jgi:hypothetical protein
MNARRVEAFLLRLVIQDNSIAGPDNWRGRIQHVASGEERKIDHLQDAVAFISQCLGVEVRLEPVIEAQTPLEPAVQLTILNRDQPEETTD